MRRTKEFAKSLRNREQEEVCQKKREKPKRRNNTQNY